MRGGSLPSDLVRGSARSLESVVSDDINGAENLARGAVKPLSMEAVAGVHVASNDGGRLRAIGQCGLRLDKDGDSTDLGEIFKLHETVTALVVVAEDLEHLGLFHVEAEGTHRDLELVVVQRAILVCVKELKGLFYFLFLLVGEFGAGMRPSLRFLCRGGVHGV